MEEDLMLLPLVIGVRFLNSGLLASLQGLDVIAGKSAVVLAD
jgi:hypothetical protein